MAFWSANATPLGNELTNISENTNSQRQPNVEGQLNTIQTAAAEMVRTWARTHRSREWTTNVSDIFFRLDSDAADGVRFWTQTGMSFKAAMNRIEPLYPDADEIIFIGENLQKFFADQNLNTTFDSTTSVLTINWETLPNVEKLS